MRNVMICVSVMLAVFLCWPLVFGGKAPAIGSHAEARVEAPAVPKPLVTAQTFAAAAPEGPKAESCYKRYQREVKACTSGNSAACRLKAADSWDMCEATGFWPN